MEVLFQFYLWDQSHVTIVWNTRETGDINVVGNFACRKSGNYIKKAQFD